MIHKIYCVYDVKARAYLPPFFMHSEGMAVRVFCDCVNDASHQFGKHPEDYSLHSIGTFDDEQALLAPVSAKLVCSGLSQLAEREGSDLFEDPRMNMSADQLIDGEDEEVLS